MKTKWNADCADDADARGSNYPVSTKKEKVYENALVIELESSGFAVLQQQNIKVYYENLESV